MRSLLRRLTKRRRPLPSESSYLTNAAFKSVGSTRDETVYHSYSYNLSVVELQREQDVSVRLSRRRAQVETRAVERQAIW